MADDELLSRARALMQAMNTMAMEQNVAIERATRTMTMLDSSPIASPTKSKEKRTKLPKLPQATQPEPKVQLSDGDAGVASSSSTKGVFRGAAITGSTLVTTFSDMRNFVKRGGSITIDGVNYTISQVGDLSANRIELSEDFKGSTNLDAEITLNNPIKQTRYIRKSSPRPISAGALMNAVQGLQTISLPGNNSPSKQVQTTNESQKQKSKIPKKAKPSKPKVASEEVVQSNFNKASSLLRPIFGGDTSYSGMQSSSATNEREREVPIELPSLSSLANASINILGQYQLNNPDDRIENFNAMQQSDSTYRKREKIVQRMLRQRKEKEELELRAQQEEQNILSKRKEASEIKVAMLRDKTAQRVQQLKENKIKQQLEAEERKKMEEIEKRERAAMAASEEAQEKLRLMQQATIARLRKRNKELRKKEQDDAAAKEQMLARLAKEKGCLVPTGNIIAGESIAGNSTKQHSIGNDLAKSNLVLRNNSGSKADDRYEDDGEEDYGVDAMGAFVFQRRESVSEGTGGATKRKKNRSSQPRSDKSKSPSKKSLSQQPAMGIEQSALFNDAGDLKDSVQFQNSNSQPKRPNEERRVDIEPPFNRNVAVKAKYNAAVAAMMKGGDDEEWSDDSIGNDDSIDKYAEFDHHKRDVKGGVYGQARAENQDGSMNSPVKETKSNQKGSKIPVLRPSVGNRKSDVGDDDSSLVSDISYESVQVRKQVPDQATSNAGKALTPRRPPIGKGRRTADLPIEQTDSAADTYINSNSNKSGATKANSQIWRKLKPIPLPAYVPVTG